VVGIVASRVIEHYYRPTIILTKSDEVVTGSARSVKGFNLYEAIYECREYLLNFGGHFAAAGLTLLPQNVDAFTKKFNEVVSNTITDEMLIPEIVIDAEINLEEIKQSFYNIILQMEPYGPENMRPLFLAKNVSDTGYSKLLKDLHIKFDLIQNTSRITGIGFNMAEKFEIIKSKSPFDIVFSLDENEWNGNTSIQLKIIDVKLSQ
jgi:single-stranded-DNA-specific exonuclease